MVLGLPQPVAAGKQVGWIIGLLAADSVSILACSGYLVHFLSLDPKLRRRLFPRQLASLALADLLASLVVLLYIFLKFPEYYDVVPDPDKYCEFVYDLYRWFRIVSVLQEVHISFVFLGQCLRAERFLVAMRFGIWVLWTVGSLVAFVEAFFFRWSADKVHKSCKPSGVEYVDIVVLIGACATCLFTNFVVFAKSSGRAPGSVQRSVMRRAMLYPLNFLASYILIIICYCSPALAGSGPLFFGACVLEYLSGFFNCITYFANSRYARLRIPTTLLQAEAGLGGEPGMRNILSFHLMFEDAEEVTVEATAAEAQRRSEMEITQLESTGRIATSSSSEDRGRGASSGGSRWSVPSGFS
mmetsp:Transcript_135719/g.307069  ORF Transcript_135719/g.307069 Transcript_135719/m.307069 type:complete len:356 (-) Transcript_135719:53-1120(-)